MLDVHPPHESVHSWRDFLLHLTTITIGLFIALSLEGCVEWQHHRHLVHEAETSLHTEIQGNAESLKDVTNSLKTEEEHLKQDTVVLKYFVVNGKLPEHSSMKIDFGIHGFDNVSWKTAQTTGALAYMPYATAQEYAGIYDTQAQFEASQQIALRDTILSLAPLANSTEKDPVPTREDATAIINHIQILQGQLLLLDSLVRELDGKYTKFLAAHPN